MLNKSLLAVLILPLVHLAASAQDTTHNSYNLFRPMPKALMRESMETDRPNITESPYTVEAGHFQYEADLVNHQRRHTRESFQRTWLFNQANLKLGLFKNTDVQLIVQIYGSEKSTDLATHVTKRASGFGDLTLRVKQNIAGNYDGTFSIAVAPYVKLPANSYTDNNSYEEGLLVPMAIKLPNDWTIGLQVEGDRLKDDDGNKMHTQLAQSLVISHVLFDKLEVFGETNYTYDFKHHQMQNYLDAALQFELGKDLKIDAGFNYGLQKDAEKEYFLGLAFRY